MRDFADDCAVYASYMYYFHELLSVSVAILDEAERLFESTEPTERAV